ncbi:protein-L-isoaspartate O-methyltransferase family protein [Comamonas sp. NoAH]|uniref:protein-L-isoaspartate O-methyltransferase family protein n=1 Tax=Comamonas halotolerans TaxID=3041496 RepID=UPI0024E1856F|nr:protein-L-isoaspartate O-methyltransferase [Comamonas sp. NoAH]
MNLPLNSLLDREDATENARYNMVQQQVRPWNVSDESVLDALYTVRREDFTPPAHYGLAFMDVLIPLTNNANAIEQGLFMFQPRVEARMINDIEVKPTDRVLEIGTGSGYSAALLSKVAKEVVTLEINAELADMARENLADAGCTNVTVRVADGSKDTLPEGPFDVILLSGSVETLPEELLSHLKEDGRLAAIVGNAPVMRFTLATKQDGQVTTKTPWDIVAPRLQGFTQASRFAF